MFELNEWAVFDELLKIADGTGDLMNPAVVAESAIVDGPPAKPFSRRKGYRRLAQQLEKDAGAFRGALHMLRAHTRLARMKTKRQIVKADDAFRGASIKAYVESPEPVKKVLHSTEKVLVDPDMTGTAAAGQALRRIVG